MGFAFGKPQLNHKFHNDVAFRHTELQTGPYGSDDNTLLLAYFPSMLLAYFPSMLLAYFPSMLLALFPALLLAYFPTLLLALLLSFFQKVF